MRRVAVFAVAAVLACFTAQVLADPPAHAPAHGWRKKHDYYVGYSGSTWERDYEITSGHCNREEIGAVVGSVAGGAIGSKVASPENRVVGIVIGAIAGALVGARIGRELDDADRGCFGHTLEIAPPGERVEWVNRASGVTYSMTPGPARKSGTGMCRGFTLVASGSSGNGRRTGEACQSSRGVWKIV